MEDDGFEFETTLREKSNVFAFPIEDAQDLDFFDQPKLSPEEIAEGTVRSENVIGSFAVYPRTKTNHRVGNTLSMPPGRPVTSIGQRLRCLPEAVRISQVKFSSCVLNGSPREQPCRSHIYKGEQKNCWPRTPANEACALFRELGLPARMLCQLANAGMG
jgi:hypothetical protein